MGFGRWGLAGGFPAPAAKSLQLHLNGGGGEAATAWGVLGCPCPYFMRPRRNATGEGTGFSAGTVCVTLTCLLPARETSFGAKHLFGSKSRFPFFGVCVVCWTGLGGDCPRKRCQRGFPSLHSLLLPFLVTFILGLNADENGKKQGLCFKLVLIECFSAHFF